MRTRGGVAFERWVIRRTGRKRRRQGSPGYPDERDESSVEWIGDTPSPGHYLVALDEAAVSIEAVMRTGPPLGPGRLTAVLVRGR